MTAYSAAMKDTDLLRRVARRVNIFDPADAPEKNGRYRATGLVIDPAGENLHVR
jgi:hypothetical protein